MSLLGGRALSRPRLLDRYIVREMLAPTGIGLLVFTFVLLIDQIPRLLAVLVARSADLSTILRVFLNLLPSILAITIPMAFLLGVLLAFGRLASDSEIIALRAVGVSPLRLLSPVMILASVMTAITFYINAVALPAANQAHREIVFALVVSKARTDVKARTFSEKVLPNGMMLYVQDIDPATGVWKNVLIYDPHDIAETKLILAKSGELLVDRERLIVRVELGPGSQHSFFGANPRAYSLLRFDKNMGWPLPIDEFFPDRSKLLLAKGDREMTLPELQQRVAELRAQHKPRTEWARFAVEWHKKFAIPAACLVFGLLGLALSLGSKKEARSAAFALSIGVIFVYYILIRLGEQAGDTGTMRPWLSMWAANIVLGSVAVVLLYLNHREAAFDPFDPVHYLRFLPTIRRQAPSAAALPGGPAPARAAGARPVVVVRIPRLRLRFPSLLDRYIVRGWVGNVGLVMLAFAAVYFLADFMDLIDDFQQNRVAGRVIVHYYVFYLFQIAFTVAPIAVLVGVLVTLGLLARRNEITAMKAGGISVYRVALPVLAMGVVSSALLYVAQEWVLPQTNKLALADRNVIKGRPAQSSDQFEKRWMLASDGRFYNFDYIVERERSPRRGRAERGRGVGGEFSVYGLSVYDVDPVRWELRERLFTSRAYWNAATETYDLDRGWRRTTGPTPVVQSFQNQRVRAIGPDPGGELERPEYFKREEKPSDTMRFRELRAYIASLESRGFDVVRLRVQLHRKLAFPAVGLVMTLLAVPFSFVVARRGALYGIGIAIVIAIVYWAVLGIFEALGNNALLPPGLAAWAPNLIFGATGFYLMLTLET
jgi:LPS export ABC transporter permease LptF/LPS export ABC transporter permease LptG